MRTLCSRAAIALCFFMGTSGFGQVINATLTGTVSDSTGALIPGVEIRATHTGTGVGSTVITNETGTYRFASLQPGPYEVSASLAGFQAQTFRLTLGTAQQIRQNFILQLGGVAEAVEVIVAADELLTTMTTSVGSVLPQRQVVDLPMIGRNVMDLATVMAGVRGTGASGTGLGSGATFAGIAAGGSGNINLQMDGVTVNTGRHATGLFTAAAINPDMVDEIRVVVAAVDPEGRGSGQVQIRTRSGTNEWRGGLTWTVRNSALNANTWSNNRQGIDKSWLNRHNYTVSVGGPIIRNQTFVFGMFDGQRGLQKQNVNATVLTDAARQGIFRFFPGVNNGHAEVTPTGSGNTRIAPVVNMAGNPLDWTQIPGATGAMQSFSVFGDALNPGDPFRTQMDPSGFMRRLIENMPRPNAFNGGDGLNTAIHRWVRSTTPGAGAQGQDPDAFNRRQFYVKIDHHFNPAHRLSGSWSHENRYSSNNSLSPWPNGWDGEVTADPKVMSVQLTSTLSPTLLNEFRYGYRTTTLRNTPAYHHSKHGDEAWAFMSEINGFPVMQHPVLFTDHMIACAGGCTDYGNKSPLSQYTNTLSWTKGAHALKTGAELRYAATVGWAPNVVLPHAYGGAGDVPVRGIDTLSAIGLLPPNTTLAQNLLLSLSGSVDYITHRFETREPTDTKFLDFRETYFHADNPKNTFGRIRDWRQNEFNFFIKDDWKVTPNFTLNLGLRYDLMRVPYLLSASGKNFTPGILGGSESIFGYSGRSIDVWMSGGSEQKGDLTEVVLIGKGTPHTKQGIWPSDTNNIAPAVGFAWSPGWWGQDRTTVRGGYQISYQLPGNSLSWIDFDIGNLPGFTYEPLDRGDGSFRDFSSISFPIPVNQQPFVGAVPLTERSQNVTVFAPDYTTPYVQNFTFGVTRSLRSNLTLDVRYVGTRGMKLHSSFNLNSADFRNNRLLQALEITRAGGNAELFDRMLGGRNIGSGVVGVAVSGSEALRRLSQTRANIANGNFAAVAQFLNTTNVGTVQPQGQLIAGGLLRSSGLFPENFFVVNPQFNNITYRTNTDTSNYHSMQTQVTLRPTHGVTYQATYTWSRSLGIFAPYRDLLNRNADYTLQDSHRKHDFRSYGTFELPFGPGKPLGGGAFGWAARVIEGWQIGAILSMNSGAPMSVSGINTLYSGGGPDIVGDFPRSSKVAWNDSDVFGNFFDGQFQRVQDPACGAIAANLRQWCTLNAIADTNGNIVLQHPGPGQLGTLGQNTIEGPGRWDLDANIQKAVRLSESKVVRFRMDATNVFNHPTPGNPSLNLNTGTFGQINSKAGTRTVQAQIRLDF